MKSNSSLQEVLAALAAARSVAVVSHYNPDADAYGSSLGLTHALRSAGKSVMCLNENPSTGRYAVIPGVDGVQQTLDAAVDLLVVCDCGTWSRIGDTLKGALSAIENSINIDHHISNDFFGKLNFVITDASSTSEVIFEILRAGGYAISPESATALFAGIVGDTGSFRYSSTSPKTFSVAHELTLLGASPVAVGQGLYGQTPLSSIRIQSEALSAMNLHFDNAVAEVVIPKEVVEKYQGTLEDVEGLAERLRDIEGVKIGVCIRQDGTIWRISLRSKNPEWNVSRVAQDFGGGGHVQAAAFRWSKGIDELRRRLLKKLEEVIA